MDQMPGKCLNLLPDLPAEEIHRDTDPDKHDAQHHHDWQHVLGVCLGGHLVGFAAVLGFHVTIWARLAKPSRAFACTIVLPPRRISPMPLTFGWTEIREKKFVYNSSPSHY